MLGYIWTLHGFETDWKQKDIKGPMQLLKPTFMVMQYFWVSPKNKFKQFISRFLWADGQF